MQYYDAFSYVYERGTELQHGRDRIKALDLLRLQPGDSVLDVPTGTGANLPLLTDRIGPTGRIYGVDFSPGMLKQAAKKVRRAGWTHVTLIEADARTVDAGLLGVDHVDAAICMLGLSVIPDWSDAFQRMFDVVRPGGRVAVMDMYLVGKPASNAMNRYYKVIAQSDQRRRFWEPLEAQTDDFEVIDRWWPGGIVRVIAGTKPLVAADVRRSADVDLTDRSDRLDPADERPGVTPADG